MSLSTTMLIMLKCEHQISDIYAKSAPKSEDTKELMYTEITRGYVGTVLSLSPFGTNVSSLYCQKDSLFLSCSSF